MRTPKSLPHYLVLPFVPDILVLRPWKLMFTGLLTVFVIKFIYISDIITTSDAQFPIPTVPLLLLLHSLLFLACVLLIWVQNQSYRTTIISPSCVCTAEPHIWYSMNAGRNATTCLSKPSPCNHWQEQLLFNSDPLLPNFLLVPHLFAICICTAHIALTFLRSLFSPKLRVLHVSPA